MKRNPFYCNICNIQLSDKNNYDKHISRLTHLKKSLIHPGHCSICNYTAAHMSNFKVHLKSKKHINAEADYRMNTTIYACNACNLRTNSKHDYLKHIKTKKHKYMSKGVEYDGEYEDEDDDEEADSQVNTIIAHSSDQTQLIIELIKSNNEFKTAMIDFFKNAVVNNGTIQTHNNSHNNTQNFNINIFLNETCKDAMNINEFIESLKIDSDVIEHLGREGYVEGMTKIFFDGLGQMQVQRRPIHCTDVKREIFYIRDDNEWLKDQDNKRIESAINRVVRKNQSNLHLWREKNPQYDTMNTPEYEFYIEIMKQCIGGGQEKEVINNRKIIRNLAKFTAVDKSLTI